MHEPPECILGRSVLRCFDVGRPDDARSLLALLTCLQLYESHMGAAFVAPSTGAAVTDDGDDVLRVVTAAAVARRWGDRFTNIELAGLVRLAQGVPWPRHWFPQAPFGARFAPLAGEPELVVLEPLAALPLRATALTVVATDWETFLRSAVLQGVFEWVLPEQLTPPRYLAPLPSEQATYRVGPWRAVAYHPKRGFLVENADHRRKWKPVEGLSEADVRRLQTEIDLKGVARHHRADTGAYVVNLLESRRGSVQASDDEESSLDTPAASTGQSANAQAWYQMFSRGVAEGDESTGGGGGGGGSGSGGGSGGGESADDDDGAIELPTSDSGMRFAAKPSDETAIGGYRDELARFAASYAAQQAAEASPDAAHKSPRVRWRRRSASPNARPLKSRAHDKLSLTFDRSYKSLKRVCWCRGVYMVPLLAIASVLVAFIGVALDVVASLSSRGLNALSTLTYLLLVNWFLYVLYMASIAFVAVYITVFVHPACAGSGLPEVRSILSGARLPDYLRTRLLPFKMIGVLALLSSGLWVGKEGPMVHIACLVGVALTRFPVFRAMKKDATLTRYVLASCCGLGPAATFGSPIGGVLFSIEATSNYFSVNGLYYAFVAAVPAALTFRLIAGVFFRQQATFTHITGVLAPSYLAPDVGEFFWAMLLAVVLAVLAVVLIELQSLIVRFRRFVFSYSKVLGNQILFSLFVVLLSAALFFPGFIGKFMSLTPLRILEDLTLSDPVALAEDGWFKLDFRLSLIIFFVVKSVMLALVLSIPAPMGLFVPSLAAGAAMGRLFGLLLNGIQGVVVGGMSDRGFAVLGAAFFTAGYTQTISTAVIVLEMTGEARLLIPMLCGCVVSFLLSRLLTSNAGIYERLAYDRHLPFVADLPVAKYPLTARDVMVPVDWADPRGGRITLMQSATSLQEIDTILESENRALVYPVVDSYESRTLIGFVSFFDLHRYRQEIMEHLSALPSVGGSESIQNLLSMAKQSPESSGPLRLLRKHPRDHSQTYADLLRQVQQKVQPLHVSSVHVTINDRSPLLLVHYLFALGKRELLPVCDKGKLVGLIKRSDLVQMLTPERFWSSLARDKVKGVFDAVLALGHDKRRTQVAAVNAAPLVAVDFGLEETPSPPLPVDQQQQQQQQQRLPSRLDDVALDVGMIEVPVPDAADISSQFNHQSVKM